MSSSETSMETTIDKDLHVTFTHMMYHLLPNPYESQEINHLTLAYFVISSIDILDSLHLVLLFSFFHYSNIWTSISLLDLMIICFVFLWFKVAKEAVVNWVLSFQVRPGTTDDPNNGMQMQLLVLFYLKNLIFRWPIWRILMQMQLLVLFDLKILIFRRPIWRVLMQMQLLVLFDFKNLIFRWLIWMVLMQDNFMDFMVPELHSIRQIRMG
jgi:hypothetical protein